MRGVRYDRKMDVPTETKYMQEGILLLAANGVYGDGELATEGWGVAGMWSGVMWESIDNLFLTSSSS